MKRESLDLWTLWQGLRPHLENHWYKLLKLIVDAEQDFGAYFNYSVLLGYSALHFLVLSGYWIGFSLVYSYGMLIIIIQTKISCLNSFTQLQDLFRGLFVPYFAVLAIAWTMYIFIYQSSQKFLICLVVYIQHLAHFLLEKT